MKLQLGAHLPSFNEQMSKIESNIQKGQLMIETQKFSKDKLENRKMKVQQKSLKAFDQMEQKRGVFQGYIANRLNYKVEDLVNGKKSLFNDSNNY